MSWQWSAEVITTTCEPPEFLRGLGCNSAKFRTWEQPVPLKKGAIPFEWATWYQLISHMIWIPLFVTVWRKTGGLHARQHRQTLSCTTWLRDFLSCTPHSPRRLYDGLRRVDVLTMLQFDFVYSKQFLGLGCWKLAFACRNHGITSHRTLLGIAAMMSSQNMTNSFWFCFQLARFARRNLMKMMQKMRRKVEKAVCLSECSALHGSWMAGALFVFIWLVQAQTL